MGKKRGSRKSAQSVWMVAGIAVAAVAILIGVQVFSQGRKAPAAVISDKELGAARNVKGKADAKVTVVEFNDYL